MAPRWTDEEDQQLVALREMGVVYEEIAETIGKGRTASSCVNRYRYLESTGRLNAVEGVTIADILEAPTALDVWRSTVDRPSWEELCEYAKRGAELHDRMRPVDTRVKRRITTSEPIFITHMSDFHLGARGVEYDTFMRTSHLLKSDERFFVIVNGPDLESAFHFFRSAEPVESSVMPVWMQIEAYKLWLQDMLPRMICVCGDNHTDERLERMLGDIGLVWHEQCPYFRTYGILELELDNGDGDPVTYEAVVTHRYKGHSIYHNLQQTLRVFRDIYPVADWYATAHVHKPAYLTGIYYPEARPQAMPEQHFLVSGTFKTGADLYGMRNFGGRGVLGLPTLMLWPDEKKIQYFNSPGMAVDVTSNYTP